MLTQVFCNWRSRTVAAGAAALIALGLVSTASAATLEIQFTGLNLTYDGTNIFDAKASNTTRAGDPAQADALTTMSILLDGSLLGVVTTDIFADIYIKDVLNIPDGGGLVVSAGNGNAFGVDLLTKNSTPGHGLGLNINTFQVFYAGGKISIAATGTASSLFANQDLPFGAAYTDPIPANEQISIVFSSSNLTNVTTAGGFLKTFNAAGTGNVAGPGVPEPSSIVLCGLGLVGGLFVWRRRRA